MSQGSSQMIVFILFIMMASQGLSQSDHRSLWGKIKSGNYVVLLRHALAPGFSDPASFDLKDCATQRNLSAQGREQSKRIGDRFRKNNIQNAIVYSSQWCRCRDTAELLKLGTVTDLASLNSLHGKNQLTKIKQTQDLKNWLRQWKPNSPLVLVTHQANIYALTGIYTESGEMKIIEVVGDAIHVVGSIGVE